RRALARTPAHTTPSLRATPPRRGGECVAFDLALLAEEGRTRQCRGGWSWGVSNPTTPSLRATPPRRGGERVALTLPFSRRRAGRDSVAEGGPAAIQTPPPRRFAPPLLDEE